jgi:hypothetical protein
MDQPSISRCRRVHRLSAGEVGGLENEASQKEGDMLAFKKEVPVHEPPFKKAP